MEHPRVLGGQNRDLSAQSVTTRFRGLCERTDARRHALVRRAGRLGGDAPYAAYISVYGAYIDDYIRLDDNDMFRRIVYNHVYLHHLILLFIMMCTVSVSSLNFWSVG